jgi:transposase InsO family protein
MKKNLCGDRQTAIGRYLNGESPTSICNSMGYSRVWFHKWLNRYRTGGDHWNETRSRRPVTNPTHTTTEMEELVKLVRLELYNEGLFHGPQAVLWRLEELGVEDAPSIRTIARIIKRNDLTCRRTGRYEPKGRKYPTLKVEGPGAVHQTDFVGPCYIRGRTVTRFYSLNTVDLATGRCAVQPVLSKGGQNTINAFWASWCRLGMPRYQQVDNELAFYGSPAHPRGMGKLIRLCLLYGIEPCFIPVREPWRNGVVEGFNQHWLRKFLKRVEMRCPEDLRTESLRFEQRHNGRYRYTKLGGKTPSQALAACKVKLCFPETPEAPSHPLSKPKKGRYHLIRFIRSDGKLDIFGERFTVPPEAIYEYVRATVDVAAQKLFLFLDDSPIDEWPYEMR